MIFGFIGLLFSCLVPGAFLADFFSTDRKSPFEFLSLSVLVSLFANFLLMFGLSAFYSVSLQAIVVSQALLVLAIIAIRLKMGLKFNYGFEISVQPLSFFEKLGIIFICVVLFLQLTYSALFPFISYDALASYNYWAKGLYLTGHFTHNFSPQFLPSLYSLIYFFGGLESENVAHSLAFLASLAGIYYVKRISQKFGASWVLSCSLLLMAPWLLMHLNSGYSDFVALSFTVACFYYLNHYLEKRGTGHLVLSAFLAGSVAALKVHGLFLPFGAFLALLATEYLGKKGNAKNTLLFLVAAVFFGLLWYAFGFIIDSSFLPGAFSLVSSDNARVAEWGNPEFASNYLLRPVAAFKTLIENNPLPLLAILLAGALQMCYSLLKKDFRLYPVSIFSLMFLPVWVLFLSFMVRGLVFTYPFFVILGSVFLGKAGDFVRSFLQKNFKRSQPAILAISLVALSAIVYLLIRLGVLSQKASGMGCYGDDPINPGFWLFALLAVSLISFYLIKKEKDVGRLVPLLLIPLLLYPAMYAIYFSFIGLTVGCIKGDLEHNVVSMAIEPDDEKLSYYLGGFYDCVMHIRKDPSLRDESFAYTDSRTRGFLPEYNISSKDPDYVVYVEGSGFGTQSRPYWAGTDIEQDMKGERKYFQDVFSSGGHHVYKVNRTAIRESLG